MNLIPIENLRKEIEHMEIKVLQARDAVSILRDECAAWERRREMYVRRVDELKENLVARVQAARKEDEERFGTEG